jgi:hypothetical protein
MTETPNKVGLVSTQLRVCRDVLEVVRKRISVVTLSTAKGLGRLRVSREAAEILRFAQNDRLGVKASVLVTAGLWPTPFDLRFPSDFGFEISDFAT